MVRRYIRGTARSQDALPPPRIKDYLGADNPVRAMGVCNETLHLAAMGSSTPAAIWHRVSPVDQSRQRHGLTLT